MKTVLLAENPLDPASWERHEVPDVRAFLVSRFASWPATARIYHACGRASCACAGSGSSPVAQDHNVTPADEAGVARLGELPGPFYVVVYPEAPAVLVPLIISAVSLAASVAMALVFKPHLPTNRGGASQNQSPNNELSDRQNKPRLNGRIPDILGTVRSTPDLVAVPYRVFEDHHEIEYSYMCIGRGAYEVARTPQGLWDVKEGSTLVEQIAGQYESVAIYGPSTSPNFGAPQVQIGTPIAEALRNAKRFDPVNGQVLGSNPGLYTGASGKSVYAIVPNTVGGGVFKLVRSDVVTEVHDPDSGALLVQIGYPGYATSLDFRELFSVGMTVTLDGTDCAWNGAPAPDGWAPATIAGTYSVVAVTDKELTLGGAGAAWVPAATAGAGVPQHAFTIATEDMPWVGPFTLDVDDLSDVYCNFTAESGLYKDSGTAQVAFDVTVRLELTPIDVHGADRGPAETFDGTILGSAALRSRRALTLKARPTFTGRCRARTRRMTLADLDFAGAVVDEVKWRDIYAISPVTAAHFGDVTTAYTSTYVTGLGSLPKERKLNMEVTRRVKRYGVTTAGYDETGAAVSGLDADGFSRALLATNRGDDIFVHVSRDPYIGRRLIGEIGLASIYDTVAAVEAYFGTSIATEFNATFDKDNLSFEETAATIAGAIFCTAYRRGSELKLSFEKATGDSTLLFNQRNKVPGSETRTVTFGNFEDHDGIEYEYVDPKDDAVVTYYLPVDPDTGERVVAVNPRKVESVGIRSRLQAHLQASRAWNKIKYQRIATEFEALEEAEYAVVTDRILVADNTRPHIQDGDVTAQEATLLTLSRPVSFEPGKSYTIFLQLSDGTVQALGVSSGATPYEVVLDGAPRIPLVTDPAESACLTAFQIVPDDDPRERAFLVTEKEPQSRMTSIVRAVNYDSRYYAADRDFQLGVTGLDGYPTDVAPIWGEGGYDSEAYAAEVLRLLAVLVNEDLLEYAEYNPPILGYPSEAIAADVLSRLETLVNTQLVEN